MVWRVQVSWSPTGDAFLVVTGSPQPKVYTRDGKEEGEFVRGDMYIRDMKNTKGHVSGCTGGAWHPTDKCAPRCVAWSGMGCFVCAGWLAGTGQCRGRKRGSQEKPPCPRMH